jgi:hypothetical protein
MPLHLSFLLFAASLAAYGGERTVGQNDYSNSSLCQQSLVCGNNVDVRYPFFLADANGTAAFDGNTNTNTSSSNCGYPGMMIACEGGRATLKLMGDNYTVLDINYDNHTVTVADADALSGEDCPRVTHNVSIPTETWLNLSTTANGNLVFLFGCVFTAATPPPAVSPINCSSFRNLDGVSYVETEPDVTPPEQWPRGCKESVVVPVLKDALLGSSSGGGNLSRLNSDGY